jgi:aminopeptidase N
VAGCTNAEAERRARLLEVESYELFLDLTTDPQAVRSRVEIRFRCRQVGASTFADLSIPSVRRVILNGSALDPSVSVSEGRLALEGLSESNLLTVEADVSYTRAGRGMDRFVDPADGAAYVLAYCYPTDAPNVFCCFDQPDLMAAFQLEVAAPAGAVCVSTSAVVDRPPDGQKGRWRFASLAAMKPCEVTLAVGPYVTVAEDEHRGATGPLGLTVRCRGSLADSSDLRRAASVVRRTLGYYERILQVNCPCDKYDIVFAPDLIPTAAQVPAFMLVNENLLHRVSDASDDFVTMVLAHEAAHLWFGCLVEGRWWDDLWLAEAMATYLSYGAMSEVLGVDSAWAEFAMQEQAAAYQADGLPSTEPISSEVETAGDALTRPSAITYSKGAAVIRQLAALIGEEAIRDGLRDYLVRFGGSSATLDDLVTCWSRASDRELVSWAQQWLRVAGVNTLRPELTLGADGSVQSLTIIQEIPPSRDEQAPAGALRTHRLMIGLYEWEGSQLRRSQLVHAELDGARAVVSELTGRPMPAAIVVNDGDLTFARIAFDDRSRAALITCAMNVGDPLTEAVCWNATWDMTTSAELSGVEFADLVARRISGGQPPVGVAELLQHAVAAADYFALPRQRSDLREHVAVSALEGAGRAAPGSRDQRALATGYALSAESLGQLEHLRSWLSGRSLPEGLQLDLDLRGQILTTLSARGLTTDDDLDVFADDDPVGGEMVVATCRALRPDPACKETAWTAALVPDETRRMAEAHARGIWAPGQEAILVSWRARYFSEALPALAGLDSRRVQRLGRLLYPATLADAATIAATDEAVERSDLSPTLRMTLLDQRTILEQVRAARAKWQVIEAWSPASTAPS